ncbi:hypothetical protein SAMN02745135_02351 [Caloranaerobacter azorensis DSM 13643]|uniref:Uncharacterized protein n=1 Tax=Caloranaerobacter azorensis DSM 13643 TaxID=1121264 RepID=A0A1M5W8Z7_9FIRM|nr:hypothetical protein [Caloranaerobacter azorensis]SHH83941.1 hypothetical protein SAMN02745135_02351 [Caloranaerobacter azorensis DSM 13643]
MPLPEIMMGLCMITLAVAFFKFQWGKGILYLFLMATVGSAVFQNSETIGSIAMIIISIVFLKWMNRKPKLFE